MDNLKTTIGLEIHVQLNTKSKMFCGCDNDAQGKAPNTVVCPVCLGLPGALPVANKEAILSTIKAGLALNCETPKIAKFDRKHYFYPDLPKGYQISQYDEPFCVGGFLEIEGKKIRLNRIHLEEDAGKLIHSGDKSLVDLNRAGTPLMEMVTEPDLTSPEQAGQFLRKLQKIVRDVVKVSEASMEKGHLRCDANISLKDENGKMSPIVEIKNLNSFKFVEKALALVEIKLSEEYAEWPDKLTKETWGYNSDENKVFLQRRKEEAADYRYFPEPDLPPFVMAEFDLEALRSGISASEEERVEDLVKGGISEADAKIIVNNQTKANLFELIVAKVDESNREKVVPVVAKAIVHNYFGADLSGEDLEKADNLVKAITDLADSKITRNIFNEIVAEIRATDKSYDEIFAARAGGSEAGLDLESIANMKLYP